MSLIVNHVNYIYGEKTAMEVRALSDVSFKIEDGEFIGVIGHTGCGKSTLMQLLNGILKPSSGEIYYNGQDISDEDFDKKLLRSKVGLVFQYPEHQLFEVDVFTDVCFGPKNMGLDDNEIQLRAYDALKAVGLRDECFYVSPFDLSGGEKRRVAIAGVLAMKPDILILDEPESSFDNIFLKDGVDSLLKEISKSIPVVIATHNNTIGISVHPDYLIYACKEIQADGKIKYHLYSGYPSNSELIDLEGNSISCKSVLLDCLEAGEEAYMDRRTSYEILNS